MSDDLISRHAAIEEVRKMAIALYGYDATSVISCAIYKLQNLPSADIVEIVRCKDCKWYKTNYSWNGNEHKVCVIEPYEPVRKGDDYCSRGERKDNG